MAETEIIVFDEKSGISVEEQKEILSKINGIAEKNRLLLSQTASGEKLAINAKKSGAVFPLAFNVAAIVIMLCGVLLLVSLNGKKDAQIRTGGAVFNLTERALIEEIRRDTAAKVASKEQEIAAIFSRLAEVDSQLAQIFSDDQILNSEQMADQEKLLALQNSYRAELAALREERAQILEDSRSREARLRAQLEERTREFAAAQTRSSNELDSAIRELDLLAGEQGRIAAMDAQMAGGFTSINELVQNSRFDQVAQMVENLRQLNNSSSVSSTRSFQPRKEFYNQALNSIEALIEVTQESVTRISGTQESGGTGVSSQQRELQERNSQLEATVLQMQRTIDALGDTISSGSSVLSLRLSELEETVSSLRAANSSLESAAIEKNSTITSLESTVAERNRTIASLENEKANFSQTVTELQAANSALEQEIVNLRNQLAIIRQALQE